MRCNECGVRYKKDNVFDECPACGREFTSSEWFVVLLGKDKEVCRKPLQNCRIENDQTNDISYLFANDLTFSGEEISYRGDHHIDEYRLYSMTNKCFLTGRDIVVPWRPAFITFEWNNLVGAEKQRGCVLWIT